MQTKPLNQSIEIQVSLRELHQNFVGYLTKETVWDYDMNPVSVTLPQLKDKFNSRCSTFEFFQKHYRAFLYEWDGGSEHIPPTCIAERIEKIFRDGGARWLFRADAYKILREMQENCPNTHFILQVRHNFNPDSKYFMIDLNDVVF